MIQMNSIQKETTVDFSTHMKWTRGRFSSSYGTNGSETGLNRSPAARNIWQTLLREVLGPMEQQNLPSNTL